MSGFVTYPSVPDQQVSESPISSPSVFLPQGSLQVRQPATVPIVPSKKRTQQDQDQDDDNARKQAERDLEKSWMDRLQLISIITTFFASTEAQLLSTTTPDPGTREQSTVAEQAANAALTGALVFHSFAAITSFTASFALIKFRLQEAKIEKGEKESDAERQIIRSRNPHITMQRIGYRHHEPPMRLLQRFHTLCIFISVIGFIIAAGGILCFVWARQTRNVGIFSSICMTACVVSGITVLLMSSEDADVILSKSEN